MFLINIKPEKIEVEDLKVETEVDDSKVEVCKVVDEKQEEIEVIEVNGHDSWRKILNNIKELKKPDEVKVEDTNKIQDEIEPIHDHWRKILGNIKELFLNNLKPKENEVEGLRVEIEIDDSKVEVCEVADERREQEEIETTHDHGRKSEEDSFLINLTPEKIEVDEAVKDVMEYMIETIEVKNEEKRYVPGYGIVKIQKKRKKKEKCKCKEEEDREETRMIKEVMDGLKRTEEEQKQRKKQVRKYDDEND